MAGHSKWKQIKHKKALTDAKKSKHFTKLIKEITVAARLGGGDPNNNARLRFLLDKGKELNMPQDNALRAIKKGTGELPGTHYEAYTYEGYGPHNIAVIVEVLTDNKNKAIAELRHAFSRHGSRIAETGSVSWMFEQKGVITFAAPALTEDDLLEKLIDHPLHNIYKEDTHWVAETDPKTLEEVKKALLALPSKIHEAEIEWIPKTTIDLQGEAETKAYEFLQALEDLDDVQHTYTNLG
jgi:YebC/PmpR family DNA-binding regulatory protein